MSNLAFIPARGKSKGLPRKNIKNIAGKPLIAWSIEQALASKEIDRVIVSTDCPEIAEIAKSYGADVPFLRPAEISGDEASTESAMLHCCEYLEKKGELPKLFILIQATSPVRKKNQLDEAIHYFNDNQFDSLLTVSKSHRFIWKNISAPVASYDYSNRPRRQDLLEQDYIETGSFYITKTDKLLETKNRLCGDIGLFEVSEDQSFEIDTQLDFIICEQILNLKNNK